AGNPPPDWLRRRLAPPGPTAPRAAADRPAAAAGRSVSARPSGAEPEPATAPDPCGSTGRAANAGLHGGPEPAVGSSLGSPSAPGDDDSPPVAADCAAPGWARPAAGSAAAAASRAAVRRRAGRSSVYA